MRIAIVNNTVPFVYGGAEFLADGLKEKLIEHGHQAIVVKIPFKWHPPQKILEHMLACRLLEVRNVDRVIGLKFPAYYIDHSDKVLWMLHQFRQAYDLWGTPYQDIPSTPEGESIRQAVIRADNAYLREAKKIYTISHVVTDRLKKFNGIDSEVLYHPLKNPEIYYCGGQDDYVFYPGRITGGKRQRLAVESMKYTRSKVKLVIAGKPDTPEELAAIRSIIEKNDLGSKVRIIGDFIPENEKVDLMANALGCIHIPFDEDSYGYVSLEAYQSCKPVITCSDSGGTLEVVEDGKTGIIVNSDPKAIAAAMDRLYEDREAAKRMGNAGLDKIKTMNISWDHVVERLTQ